MSAINPASFASPSLGLQAPSGIGPGAVGVTRSTQPERRGPQPEPAPFANVPSSRNYPGAFPQSFGAAGIERGSLPQTAFQPSGYAYGGYSPFGVAPRNNALSPSGYAPMDNYQSFGGNDLARFPSPHGATPHEGDYARSHMAAPGEAWIGNFQGLSLNSR